MGVSAAVDCCVFKRSTEGGTGEMRWARNMRWKIAYFYLKESLDKQLLSNDPPPIHVPFTSVESSQLTGLVKMCGNKKRSSYFICFHTVSNFNLAHLEPAFFTSLICLRGQVASIVITVNALIGEMVYQMVDTSNRILRWQFVRNNTGRSSRQGF